MMNCASLINYKANSLQISGGGNSRRLNLNPLRYLFLFALLCTLGVGESFAKWVYVDRSNLSGYGTPYVHYWGGTGVSDTHKAMTCVSGDLFKSEIPDNATTWQVCRYDNGSYYNYLGGDGMSLSDYNVCYIMDWDKSYWAKYQTRTYTGSEKIYFKNLKPDKWTKNWIDDGLTGWIHLFDLATGNYTDVKLTLLSGTAQATGAIYVGTPGAGTYSDVIVVRCNNTSSISWPAVRNDNRSLAFSVGSDPTKNMIDNLSPGSWSENNGGWIKYSPTPALIGTMNGWSVEANVASSTRVNEYSETIQIISAELPASTDYSFRIIDGTNQYGASLLTITGATKDGSWEAYSTGSGKDVTLTTGEAGTYYFQYNTSSHYVAVYYPKARLTKNKYLYFDGGANTAWTAKDPYSAKFSYKYYDSHDLYSDIFCDDDTLLEDHVYYTMVPNVNTIGRVQVMCMYDDHSSQHYYANSNDASERTNSTPNCLIAPAAGDDGINLTWGTYCPPTESESLSDNSTSIVPGTTGTGTSVNPILVITGTTLKVTASASKAVADGDMTIKYDFKVDDVSQQDGTSATYSSYSASTNNTTYKVSVDAYTNYNLDNTKNSTKHSPSALYYKALNEYTIKYYGGENAKSGSHADDKQYHGIAKTLPGATFTRDHYTQTGWATSDGGTKVYDLNTAYTANTDLDLYPFWTEVPYTVYATAGTGGTVGAASYTAYVETTTAITASPATGYKFDHWSVESGDVTIASTNSKSTTITAESDGSIQAHFDYRWSISGTFPGATAWDVSHFLLGNVGNNDDSGDTCYVEIALPANTPYRFTVVNRGDDGGVTNGWYRFAPASNTITYATKDSPLNLEPQGTEGYSENCNLTTAGAGTYKFVWNITDKSLYVVFPESYQVTAAKSPDEGTSTVTPSVATYMSTSEGGEITASPDYAHYFVEWTSSAGGTFTNDKAATTTFKPGSTAATVTASMPRYTVFVEGTFQVRNSSGETIGIGGSTGVPNSRAIQMDYDAGNKRYFLHTYSTPKELAKKDSYDAYFYFRTSELDYSLTGGNMYYANKYSTTGDNCLSVAGFGNARGTKLGNAHRGFLFTGTEEENVILYFDGTNVWYELEKKTFTDTSDDHKWSTASNWSPSGVPAITDMVYISKPVTVDIDHAKAKRIILDQNGDNTVKLTIQANKGLEVLQTVQVYDGSSYGPTTAADLVLESSASGNASLVFDNSNSDAATVQMYSPATISTNWNWQFMGTPFTSANALYSYYGAYLYEWQSDGTWAAVSNGGTMTAFTGYCITQDAATTYTMSGTLNPTSSDKEISVPASKEFVMANSWTAPISVCNFTDETLPLATKTIYLFNTGHAESDASSGSAAGTYIAMPISSAIYTGNYLIAPMEGFYVDNRSGSAATVTLKYDELVRPSGGHTDIVAGAMHAPKRVAAENEPEVMKIKATGSRYSERIVILAREDFSTGFDNGWDGKNLNEPGVAPILYALREDGTKDAVSAIPNYEGTVVGFRKGEDSQYTFSFEYDGAEMLYLNDLKQQTSTLIDAEHSYSFTTASDDAEARFIISATPIAKTPTGIEGTEYSGRNTEVRKLMIDGNLYIIRGGRMYNAIGLMIK